MTASTVLMSRAGRTPGAPPLVDGDDPSAVPTPAEGLELLGEQASSGHRQPPSLVRRPDGQIVQLTPLLYRVLEAIDGRNSHADIAAVVSERIGKSATTEDMQFLIKDKLRPLGLLASADGSTVTMKKANPLLAIHGRVTIVNGQTSQTLARCFTWLFRPLVMLPLIAAFVFTAGWVLFDKGLGGAARHALYEPSLLLMLFGLTVVSAGFHELGHAAACLYGGASPGAMGVGLYIVWPAFYTDVTDAYRLGRRGRLRVDLGGIYFNAVFGVVAMLLWRVTGWEALLLILPIQLLQMLRQLLPLVRLDGYHILADLTGVPDLFAHIKPVLLAMMPTRWGRSEARLLRPWVRVVVTVWVLLVVPALGFSLLRVITVLPRLVATAWDSLGLQWQALCAAWGDAQLASAALRLVSMAAISLPVVGVPYMLGRTGRRLVRWVWTATAGRPARRTLALITGGGMVVSLAMVWWPSGQYDPIRPDERGRVQDELDPTELVPFVPRLISDDAPIAPTSDVPMWPPTTDARPSANGGSSAGPRDSGGTAATVELVGAPEPDTPVEPWRPPWGVRFNPPTPGAGDNFAIAVNTADGTWVIDLAFSRIFADGDTIDNSNRAYALVNCLDCIATAVAFQVVFIMEQADVVIPDNLAVALTASCVSCVAYALAIQLVVSLTGPLSDEAIAELDEVWARLEALENGLGTTIPISEAAPRLMAIETAILQVLLDDGAVEWPGSTGTTRRTSADNESSGAVPTSTSRDPSPSAPSSTPAVGGSPATTTTAAAGEPSPTPATESSSGTTTEPLSTTTTEPVSTTVPSDVTEQSSPTTTTEPTTTTTPPAENPTPDTGGTSTNGEDSSTTP